MDSLLHERSEACGGGQDEWLTFRDLKALGVPWSRKHVFRLMKTGKFPQCVRFGAGTVRWRRREIEAWVRNKEEDR